MQGSVKSLNQKYPSRVATLRPNAKSVLSVLGACVKCGEEVEFICDGSDEEEALKAIIRLVDDRLGE